MASIETKAQIAKELTLAAMDKLRLQPMGKSEETANSELAKAVGDLYKELYKSVSEAT